MVGRVVAPRAAMWRLRGPTPAAALPVVPRGLARRITLIAIVPASVLGWILHHGSAGVYRSGLLVVLVPQVGPVVILGLRSVVVMMAGVPIVVPMVGPLIVRVLVRRLVLRRVLVPLILVRLLIVMALQTIGDEPMCRVS